MCHKAGSGVITIQGRGGDTDTGTAKGNDEVVVQEGAFVTNGTGAVIASGTGGNGLSPASAFDHGIITEKSGKISAGGASNVIAGYVQSGLDGFTTYTATTGQVGFPTCLTGPCLPVSFSSNPALAPARNITIIAGMRSFYTTQFAQFGLIRGGHFRFLASNKARAQRGTIGRVRGPAIFSGFSSRCSGWSNNYVEIIRSGHANR